MNIDYEEIPFSTTSSTPHNITMAVNTPSQDVLVTSDQPKAERIIVGVSEFKKDIILLCMAGFCLLLGIIILVICMKWRHYKKQNQIQFNLMKSGSSQSVFNTSKIE